MPNHVSQRMTLVGPRAAVEKFRRAHFIHGEPADLQSDIDTFEKKKVDMTALLELRDAGETLADDQARDLKWWENWGAQHHEQSAEAAKSALAKIAADEPGVHFSLNSFTPVAPFIFQGGLGLEDEKRTGRRNWYVDNRRRFGTKWDAYSCNIEQELTDLEDGDAKFVFYYETAWSQPDPILALIATAYPDVHVTVEYIDEGWCFWGVRHSFGYQVTDNERGYEDIKDGHDLEAFKELMWLERHVRGWDDERFKEWVGEEKDDGEWDARYGWLPEEFRDPTLIGTHKPAILLAHQLH